MGPPLNPTHLKMTDFRKSELSNPKPNLNQKSFKTPWFYTKIHHLSIVQKNFKFLLTLFYNAMQCAMTKFKNLRYKKNEVIPELFYFKVRVYMEFAQNHRKNERRVVQFCLHLRIQYIFDLIQFLEFPTLYSHLLRLNVLRFR